ncbi:MAG TPA: Mrp/NBP35 family ATP-binding protein [Oscillatoriaceae cyanobacterium]
MTTSEELLAALQRLRLPETDQDPVALGWIKDAKVVGRVAAFTLALPPSRMAKRDDLERAVREGLRGLPGIDDLAIHVVAGAEQAAPQRGLANVKHVIAIGSGKGGVGKSTVSANLALALAKTGAKVGLLDADIYGPSIPLLLGVADQKPLVQGNKLQPIERLGLRMMSMGFLLPNADDPVVWRGPMLASALRQFVQDVNWGELDYLLVDLPPGTGDVPLSLVQLLPLSGAIVVITPQAVAAAIGTKTLKMFQQTRVPILGIVENMSHFVCEHCGHDTPIFDTGGGKRASEASGVPFLGEIPLDPKIRHTSDMGTPVVVAEPDSPPARAFVALAEALREQVSTAAGSH